MEELSQNPSENIRLPKAIQIIICIIALLLTIFICMCMLGKAEYDQSFCEDRLELQENEKAALLKDSTRPYKILGLDTAFNNLSLKTEVQYNNDKYSYGCCRVPKGKTRISKSQYCIYTSEYTEPNIKERITNFLKSFK